MRQAEANCDQGWVNRSELMCLVMAGAERTGLIPGQSGEIGLMQSRETRVLAVLDDLTATL